MKASLDKVADEAGYSKGAVYSNFEGKEALFLELLKRKFESELDSLHALLREAGDTDQLIAAVRAYYENNIEVLDFTAVAVEFLTQVGRGSPHRAACARLYEEQRAAVSELLSALFRRAGRKLPAPAVDLALWTVSLTLGLAAQRSLEPSAITGETWGRAVEQHLRALLALGQE